MVTRDNPVMFDVELCGQNRRQDAVPDRVTIAVRTVRSTGLGDRISRWRRTEGVFGEERVGS